MLKRKLSLGAIGNDPKFAVGAVVLIILAGIAIWWQVRPDPPVEPKGPWFFKCTEDECDFEKKIDDVEELNTFREKITPKTEEGMPLVGMGPGMGAMKYVCPKCKEDTLLTDRVLYCPEHNKIYFPEDFDPDDPYASFGEDIDSTCPVEGCDYDPVKVAEAAAKKSREERKNK